MGNGVPLYEAAKRKILKRLETREWLPGAKLPPEGELSRELGVSVGTLRHAVGELCEEGILWRRQGSGTYVRSYRDGGAGFWNRFQPFQTRDGMPMIMVDPEESSSSKPTSRGRRVLCPPSPEEGRSCDPRAPSPDR